MADQCIVCLDPLDDAAKILQSSSTDDDGGGGAGAVAAEPVEVAAPAVVAASSSTSGPTSSTGEKAPHHHNHDHIAVIQVCGHVLHDSCLREWTEKANSCPICRQAFHLVQVYDKIGGSLLSTYKVEDKKQVIEFDPQAWLDENPEEDEVTSQPCPVCNLSDQEEVLLLCDSCDTPYHTHCLGMDSVPDGAWFCIECRDLFAPQDEEPVRSASVRASGAARRRGDFFPRTRASMRRSRNRLRSDEWQGAWGQIAGRIWDVLNLDLDNDGDDALEEYRRSQQLREREMREYQRWQQRVNIASRLGARDVFTRNIPNVLGGNRRATLAPRPSLQPPQQPQQPPQEPPPQQSREERRAWGALERAMECSGNGNSPSSRKRKSRSSTGSPREREPAPEPERRLKRPRTRRVAAQAEASASKPLAASNATHTDRVGPVSAAQPAQPDVAAPSFLTSLLKEVEMSTPSDEENVRTFHGYQSHPPDASSPGSSPAGSPYGSPRAITPPPNVNNRPTSPTLSLSSHIEPIYPPANYSPTRIKADHSDSESRAQQNGTSRPVELRQPRPRRRTQPVNLHRSEDASPTRQALPLEMKESISSIVRGALKPHWKSSKLTAEQYEAINRDVSRKLYEGVTDPTLVDGDARRTWEEIATKEVASAVEDLKA